MFHCQVNLASVNHLLFGKPNLEVERPPFTEVERPQSKYHRWFKLLIMVNCQLPGWPPSIAWQAGNRMVDILGKDIDAELLKLPAEERIFGRDAFSSACD